jgi:hypothetical protein
LELRNTMGLLSAGTKKSDSESPLADDGLIPEYFKTRFLPRFFLPIAVERPKIRRAR